MDEADLAAKIEQDIADLERGKATQYIDSGAFTWVESTILLSTTFPPYSKAYNSLYFTADTQLNPFAELGHSYKDIEMKTRVSPVDSKTVHFRWAWANTTASPVTITIEWSVISNDTGTFTWS